MMFDSLRSEFTHFLAFGLGALALYVLQRNKNKLLEVQSTAEKKLKLPPLSDLGPKPGDVDLLMKFIKNEANRLAAGGFVEDANHAYAYIEGGMKDSSLLAIRGVRAVLEQLTHSLCYASIKARENHFGKSPPRFNSGEFNISGVRFTETWIDVPPSKRDPKGYKHHVTYAGKEDAPPEKTIVFVGGIPTNPTETFYWIVVEMLTLDPSLYCIIVLLPYAEPSYTCKPHFYETEIIGCPMEKKSTHSAYLMPNNEEVGFEDLVDNHFNHQVQGEAVRDILVEMNINRSVIVGHDRGAAVLDYFVYRNPEKVIAYCRGAQLWDTYEESLDKLAPAVIIGPPHKLFAIPWQCKLIFWASVCLNQPIQLISPGARKKLKNAKKGTEDWERSKHLELHTIDASDNFYTKIRNTFKCTNSVIECENRRNGLMKTNVPIMQFQGWDELARNEKGTAISDQPFFGQYNLVPNEIEDLYPGCTHQDPMKLKKELLTPMREGTPAKYDNATMKKGARMTRYSLIPDACHFEVIENPAACAAAIYDFLKNDMDLPLA